MSSRSDSAASVHCGRYLTAHEPHGSCPGTPAQDHPEDTCEECGGRNVVWFAPNDLWNRVMRGGDRGAPDVLEIVCPVCFIRRAEAAGVEATGWLVQPEVIHAD